MDLFEITVKKQSYKINRDVKRTSIFTVFNYATCHVIKKNNFGTWEEVEHRFGLDGLPVAEIGDAIDQHYHSWPLSIN